MGYCAVKPFVRNEKGELVESKLFNDLSEVLPNRNSVKNAYALGTNETFLESIYDKVDFDDNGQITMSSLLKYGKIDIDEEKTLSSLNKELKSGSYEYNDAINRLQNFNRNNSLRDRYMAVITKEDGSDKYRLFATKRSDNAEEQLEKTIRDKSIKDMLVYKLNQLGVNVEFLDDAWFKGKYSTENVEKAANGLYNLVQIFKGNNIEETLAEEAGHVAIGCLGNNPLVKRLTDLLTPEVQKQIFGDEYESKNMGSNAERETAGYLVGQALMEKLENKTPWQKLAHRITNFIKNIFNKINPDEITSAIEEAKRQAAAIAEGFLERTPVGDVEDALKIKETLFDAKTSKNKEILLTSAKKFHKMIKQLEAIGNDSFTEGLKEIMNDAVNKVYSDIANQREYDEICLDGIITGLKYIDGMIGQDKEINSLLDDISFPDGKDFFTYMAENGRNLQRVHTFVQNAVAIIDAVEQALPDEGTNIESLVYAKGNVKYKDGTVNLKELVSELRFGINAVKKILTAKQTEYFLKFMEHQYGKKFVRSSAKLLFKKGNFLKLEKTEAKDIPLNDILRGGDDISMFHRFIASASNGGIITQIADKCSKLANKEADDKTNKIWDRLRIMSAELEKIGLDTRDQRFLYEKIIDENGNETLTGNIMTDLHYGKWERDYQKAYKDAEKAFKKNIKDNVLAKKIEGWDKLKENEREEEFGKYWNGMDDIVKGVIFNNYAKSFIKKFHETHSTYNKITQQYEPNRKYNNGEYDNYKEFYEKIRSNKDLYDWYNKYMQLKQELDNALPEGSIPYYRLPQFKGTYSNQVKNLEGEGQKHSRWKSFLRTQILEKFCESSEDRDYGSQQTYNEKEEFDEIDLFEGNTHDKDEERVNRLPLFGINKLKDMSQLSTNLLNSILAYAGMAYSYESMNNVVSAFEVGREVLLNRKTGNNMTERERAAAGLKTSRDYNRYLKFLDKQVYGIGSTKTLIGKKLVVEKTVQTMTGFSSKYFLAGNVVGGLVNLGTGFTEILREALADDFFDIKDWSVANRLYFDGFVDNWADMGSNNTDNKTALFIRHFNMRGDNKQDYREWNRHSRIYNIFGKSMMMPYTSGDHYMQCISYLAIANNTKVVDEKGNEMSLYEAYKVVKNEHGGKENGYTLALDGTFFISKDARDKYNKLENIISALENDIEYSSLMENSELDETHKRLLLEAGVTEENYENAAEALKKVIAYSKTLKWSGKNESILMDRARELNNRMHGIYNSQDKTALHQNFLGAAFLAMKGWAIGQAERLFSPNHHSVALDKDVEGSLVTLAKVILSFSPDAKGITRTLRAMILPWGKKTEQLMYAEGFDEFQIKNMRRNVGDFGLLAGLLLLISVFKGMKPDDKDDDGVAGFLYYMSSRLYREGAALRVPTFWKVEKDNLLDIQPVFVAAMQDIFHTAKLLAGTPFASKDNSTYYYKTNVPGKAEKGDPKFVYALKRSTPFLKSVYPMQHGYKAYESYVYGQKIKSR